MTNLQPREKPEIRDLVEADFKRYLSFRPDLLPRSIRAEWAALPTEMLPFGLDEVRRIVTRELGRPLDSVFSFFDETPLESRLSFQRHSAWLQSGESVTVKLSRPGIEEFLLRDSTLDTRLEGAFSGQISDRLALQSAVADFRDILVSRNDFIRELAALRLLGQEARECPVLNGPVVHSALCTPRLLVVGQFLGSDPLTPGAAGADVTDTLCLVWLRQALLGKTYPLEPDLVDFASVPPRRIGITGGVFSALPVHAQLNLTAYLSSVAVGDPDRARECLLREMTRQESSIDTREFVRRFKYASPFRDSTWSDASEDRLIENVLLHWEIAHQFGYRPNTHLLRFYTGILRLTAATDRLCPDRDVLREAWQGLRSQILLSEIRKVTDQRYWIENFEKYSALISAASESIQGLAGSRALVPERLLQMADADAGRGGSIVVAAALLLVLVSFALVASRFAGTASASGQATIVIVFVALGIALLREVIRS